MATNLSGSYVGRVASILCIVLLSAFSVEESSGQTVEFASDRSDENVTFVRDQVDRLHTIKCVDTTSAGLKCIRYVHNLKMSTIKNIQ